MDNYNISLLVCLVVFLFLFFVSLYIIGIFLTSYSC